MQGYCTTTEYTGSLGYNSVSDGWVFKEKSKQMYPVMGEKQMSKRLGGIKERLQSLNQNVTLHLGTDGCH